MLELFAEPLPDATDTAVALVRSPWPPEYLLEVAGSLARERCGATLDRWIVEPGEP